MLEQSSILVTGGAGFIGSCFVRHALAEPRTTVINLDKLTYAGSRASLAAAGEDPRHVFIEADIADEATVAALLRDYQPRAVIHFAAQTHVDRSIDAPAAFVETNATGTMRLLETALRFWRDASSEQRARFRFLHVSTDEVYGSAEDGSAHDEQSRYYPNSPYAASKAAADHFVRAYGHTYGLPVQNTHSSNNYGPFQFPEKLVPLMVRRALAGRSLPVYGDGQHIRDWLFVEDHCRALRAVLESAAPGEVFNIGSGESVTNLNLVKKLCRLLDELATELPRRPTAQLIELVEDRPGHDFRYAMDCGKIQRVLGWRPEVDLDTGLRRTVEWCLRNQAWLEHLETQSDYRQQRLGRPHREVP